MVKPAKNNISNSTTETDLFGTASTGYTVPAGLMGTDGIARVHFMVPILNNSGGAANVTLRFYFGSTKWYDSGTVSVAANANSHALVGHVFIANQNATNSQWAAGWASFGTTTGATAGFGNPLSQTAPTDGFEGAALAVDTTANQNLRMTLQFGTAAATITATPKLALIEIV